MHTGITVAKFQFYFDIFEKLRSVVCLKEWQPEIKVENLKILYLNNIKVLI